MTGGVVVTGGSQGIGRAICEFLVAQNYDVVSLDVQPAPAGAAFTGIVGDTRDPDALDQACAAAGQVRGLVGFVANAGITRWAPTEELSRSDWDDVVSVDLTGVFEGARAAHRHFGETGSIAVISSVAGDRGVPVRAPYCATKAGALGLVRALATEWGPRGIRVNGVTPGVIETDLIRRARESGAMASAEEMSRTVPLRRLGDPTDVARAVAFLLSDASDYITGITLPVDGGLSTMLPPLG